MAHFHAFKTKKTNKLIAGDLIGSWLRAKRHAYYIHTQGSDTNCVTYNI